MRTADRMKTAGFMLLLFAAVSCAGTDIKVRKDGTRVYGGGSELSSSETITGRVVDSVTGRGISGAAVEIKNANMGVGYYKALSGSDGVFEITGFIKSIKYVMAVQAESYVDYNSEGIITPGHIKISLAPEAVIEGAVTDSSGKPVKGAEVRLNRGYGAYSSSKPEFYITNDDGSYRFGRLPSGAYSLSFAKAGHITETASLDSVKAGEKTKLPMKLYRPSAISGKVMIGGLNIPAPGIRVTARGREYHSAQTFDDGTYIIEDLKPGRYELYMTHQGFTCDKKIDINLTEGVEIKDSNFTAEPRNPEAHLHSYRYTFAPGNKLEFSLRTIRLETVNVTVYSVPPASIAGGDNFSYGAGDDARGFKKVASWEEPIERFKPYDWMYSTLSIKEALPTGGYCIDIRGAGRLYQRRFFTVTSIGIVTKRTPGGVFVYATDLVESKPLEKASVLVFDPGSKRKKTTNPENIEDLPYRVLRRSVTDSSGTCAFTLGSAERLSVLAVSPDGSYAICNTGSASAFEKEKNKYMIYTERPVYRSGDTVHFKVVGKQAAGLFVPMKPAPVYFKIVNTGNGRTVLEGQGTLDEWGAWSSTVRLEADWGLGAYVIQAGPAEKNLYASGRFYAEQYRKPEFKVEASPVKEFFINGDDIEFRVDAKYFFGAPVKDSVMRYRFYETRLKDSETTYWWEEDDSGSSGYSRLRLDGQKYLNENGMASLKLEAGNYPYDREVRVEVTVTDSSNVSITSSASVRVGRGEYYIKVDPEANFFEAGAGKKIAFKTLNQAGQPVRADLKVEMYPYIWKPYQRVYVHDSRPVFSGKITTDSKGSADINITKDFSRYGEYDIIVSGFDKRGNRITASRVVWVYHPHGGRVDSRFKNLEMELSTNELKTDGDITCLLKTRYPDAHVLLTAEGKDIYWSKVVRMKGNVMPVVIHARQDWAPNFYVSAILQQKRALFTASSEVSIPVEGTELEVTAEPDRESYLPGETVKINVRTLSGEGMPVSSDISIGVVDEAIYSIRSDFTPHMRDFFYSKISNWVLTTYSYPVNVLAGAGKDGKIKVREKFEDTAYWNPRVRTGKDGRAAVSFKLPDNLTTWRITARGHDKSGRMGETKRKFKCTQDLIARIGSPRFMVEGDSASCLGLVNSNTSAGMTQIGTDMRLAGSKLKPAKEVRMSLPPFGAARELFRFEVPSGPKAVDMQYTADAGSGVSDAVKITIPVERRGSLYKIQGTGVIGASELKLESVRDISGFDFVPETLKISVSPTPLIKLVESSGYLIRYPYGCVEQTVNSFMPVMRLHSFLKKTNLLHLADEADVAKVKEKTAAGLRRITTIQNSDGSWGWWSGDRGNAFLTGFVLESLYAASREGHSVNIVTLKDGLQAAGRMLSDLDPKRIDERAYLLYAVSLYGKWDDKAYASLSKSVSKNPYGASMLLSALSSRVGGKGINNKNGDAAELKDDYRRLVKELISLVKKDGSGIYWEAVGGQRYGWPGGKTEITARAMRALVSAGERELPAGAMSTLMAESREGRWSSTRETSLVIYSACEYLEKAGVSAGRPFIAQFKLNGRDAASISYDPAVRSAASALTAVVDLTDKINPQKLTVVAQGKGAEGIAYEAVVSGTLYFKKGLMQSLSGGEKGALDSLSNGISLVRTFESLTRVKDISSREYLVPSPSEGAADVGEEILVKLRFTAQDDFEYLMLEDFLPSGFEVADTDAFGAGEFRAERWDNRVIYFLHSLKKGEVYEIGYTIRAELPGIYMARPARMECMYEPSVQGWSKPALIEVREKD